MYHPSSRIIKSNFEVRHSRSIALSFQTSLLLCQWQYCNNNQKVVTLFFRLWYYCHSYVYHWDSRLQKFSKGMLCNRFKWINESFINTQLAFTIKYDQRELLLFYLSYRFYSTASTTPLCFNHNTKTAKQCLLFLTILGSSGVQVKDINYTDSGFIITYMYKFRTSDSDDLYRRC